ncbi:MotA/TolQ/ExbB proton channel family protein [Sphingomonas rubra]|uniref:Chemotaxis protein MotA n=1 Tax=Sphingomonas rubra TaxID=634430 RepID=A0A1I5UJQ2_9SPHN|nr:MotA/TolQ/ExbB proton channel family protein [Sphingomonas rubra]SFP95409.1 chemotaxis protein MotA [Sphingomonas rubra]
MDPTAFIDPAALAIVGGGTLLAAALRTPARDLARAGKALKVLPRTLFAAAPALAQLTALSRIAQRHGVIALDRSVVADPDLRAGVDAVVDGAAPEEVEARLHTAQAERAARHAVAADVWAAAAETAPAMGMVGTLVGLARMFAEMESTAAVGAGMGVALLATLYGALAANLLLMPIAARLRAAARVEAAERATLVAPLVALARREAPRRPLQSVA